MVQLSLLTAINYEMEKEKELKPMITESPACATSATMKLTKVTRCQNKKDWTCGKIRTEKRLPAYLSTGFYIPKFEEMTYETTQLLAVVESKLKRVEP